MKSTATQSVLETARQAFSWAKAIVPGGSEFEIYLSQGRGRSVVWSEGHCEDMEQAEGGGVGIRVILLGQGGDGAAGGRQGYSYTTNFSRESVEKAAQMAVDAARVMPADSFRRVPAAKDFSRAIPKIAGLHDPETFSETIPELEARLKEGEARILKKFPLLKSVLRAGFSEGTGETAILNSRGVEGSFASTHSGLGVSCLAEKDGERQEGGFGLSRRFKKELDWTAIFDQGALRTLALLGGKTIPSGAVPVVFDPTVACEFLSLISGSVCADAVQKGKSAFAGKIGKTVASELVTVVDDGTLDKGLASSPVDDEGVPTQKTTVIGAGKLERYLYDTYAALKDKTISTGNASRAGFKSSPASGSSNFYLAAGKSSRAKLLAETRGLYLYDVMGLHMADPISGEFSLAVMGAWLDHGEFKHGVRGVTLAGNWLDVLKNMDSVCDDLTFFGSLGSPTFRVQGLMVSGA